MKLIVQIPCLNEADQLPETLAEIPRHIDGIDSIEVLLIDDGSTDGSAAVAKQHGVDHVVPVVPCVLAGMQRGSSLRSHQSGSAGACCTVATSRQSPPESCPQLQSDAEADPASRNSTAPMANTWRRVLMEPIPQLTLRPPCRNKTSKAEHGCGG